MSSLPCATETRLLFKLFAREGHDVTVMNSDYAGRHKVDSGLAVSMKRSQRLMMDLPKALVSGR